MSLGSQRTVRQWPSRAALLAPGRYVTDGHRLFRVVSQFRPGTGGVFASLEDCRTLEVTPYAPDELYAMDLRSVQAGATR